MYPFAGAFPPFRTGARRRAGGRLLRRLLLRRFLRLLLRLSRRALLGRLVGLLLLLLLFLCEGARRGRVGKGEGTRAGDVSRTPLGGTAAERLASRSRARVPALVPRRRDRRKTPSDERGDGRATRGRTFLLLLLARGPLLGRLVLLPHRAGCAREGRVPGGLRAVEALRPEKLSKSQTALVDDHLLIDADEQHAR